MNNLVLVNRQVRNLILDYALGAVIITLLPIPKIWIGKAIALLFLNYCLIRGIGRLWKFQPGGDFLARIGSIFGLVGSISLGILAWIGMIALSVRVPEVYVLASGVGIFAYFWGIGQTVHHFYLSGYNGAGSDEV